MPAKNAEHTSIENAPGEPPFPNMVWVPGGTFLMGSDDHYPEEAPTHYATVSGFWMDTYAVTNSDFRTFINETGYVTMAERVPNPEDYPGADPALLVPGGLVFKETSGPVDLRYWQNWWEWVPGAEWRHPTGPRSSIKKKGRHPVVQVAYEDVEAYAAWAGKELPTEAQAEFAARGGNPENTTYAWGDEFAPDGRMMANTWQGEFPWQNLLTDGYAATAPVGSFPANGYGLYDMIGNVWEWTSDWFVPNYPDNKEKTCCTPENPRILSKDESYDPLQPAITIPRKVLKGGSHLCASNYCMRYRPAARSAEMIDTSTCHIGFRCVVNVDG